MKSSRRVFSIVLACILALMSMMVTASAEDTMGGVVGNMRWTFKSTEGALHIDCAGDLPNMQPAPWQSYADMITTVVFYDQVTSIPAGFLAGCNNVTVVKLPASLRTVGAGALSSLPRLSYIVYQGSLAALQSVQMSADDLAKIQQSAFQQATIEVRGAEQVYVPVAAPAAQEETTTEKSSKKSSHHHHHHHKHGKKRPVRRVRRVVTPKNVMSYVNKDGDLNYASVVPSGKPSTNNTLGTLTQTYKVVRDSEQDKLYAIDIVTDVRGNVLKKVYKYLNGDTLTKEYSYNSDYSPRQVSATYTQKGVSTPLYDITFDEKGNSNLKTYFGDGSRIITGMLEHTEFGEALLTVEEASEIEGASDLVTGENLQGEIEVTVDENGEEVPDDEEDEEEEEEETAGTITQSAPSDETPAPQSTSEETPSVTDTEDNTSSETEQNEIQEPVAQENIEPSEPAVSQPAVEETREDEPSESHESREAAPEIAQNSEPSEPSVSQPAAEEYYEKGDSSEKEYREAAPSIEQDYEPSESYGESYGESSYDGSSFEGGYAGNDFDAYRLKKKKKNLRYYDYSDSWYGYSD